MYRAEHCLRGNDCRAVLLTVLLPGGKNGQGMLLSCIVLQVVYPATSCVALSDSFCPTDREAHAGAMRQATALLKWADKFGAAMLMQRAEQFLCKRLRLMTTVRPPCMPCRARTKIACQQS